MGAEEESSARIIKKEIEEELEGERVDSDDYFFERIGKPIPILKDAPLFDLESHPPSSPLAVSLLHRLIFLAHPSGFYVAKTKDVMDAAEELKAEGTRTSVQELGIVDVPIGKPRTLSLSFDSSTLAASVDAHLHFFLVDSLLNTQPKPFFSCALDEPSSFVKDFKWRRRSETSYLVLSNHGNLYHAALTSSLQHVMNNVDAVEWSSKGTYISVAKENVLHIFSSKFKERLRIFLSLKSWTTDSNSNCTVKVDAIKWVRADSIVLGCLQQTADGQEENYLLQVIRSKDGKITDASSKSSVLVYYDLFSGLIDDILPYGNGPYLVLSYLEQCGLAIAANRKNTDQHILLLRWSVEGDVTETAIVDIDRDTWIPRVELQGNGDDNLIMGLCVDNVSLYRKIEVEVGLQQRELSPYCVLFCVTLEGKLAMFYVASAAGPASSPETDLALDDEEEESLPDLPAQCVPFNLSSGSEMVALGFPLKDVSKREPDIVEGSELSKKKEPLPSGNTKISMSADKISHEDGSIGGLGIKSVVSVKPSVSDGQEKASVTKMHQGVDGQQVQCFGQQSAYVGQSSFKNSSPERLSCFVKHPSEIENKQSRECRSSSVSFSEEARRVPVQINDKDVQKTFDQPKDSQAAFSYTGLQGGPSVPLSSERGFFSGGFESRSGLTSASIQGYKSDTIGVSADAGNVPANFAGKPFFPKDNIGISSPPDLSIRPTQTAGQKSLTKAGMIDSLPSIRSSQLPSQESLTVGRSTNHWPQSSKNVHKASSMLNSEPYLAKQFGNIKEMAKELDSLLKCIEEPGGFRDACTISQRASVGTLEERMQTLSRKCRTWKSMMDEQVGEVLHLLDKTVQVMARKIYLDGIVKQASDSRYWELWNHQKLSSEHELKRRHILNLNQVLTNQLIELERHFNNLELYKFDENGVHKDWRASQSRYRPSRQIQSLHSLHNTTNSQLVAAEQLSECLSKQMAVLSIESPMKQKNVKKELFETIGIPYEPAFSSPDSTKVGDSSSPKKLLLSGSVSNKSRSRRRQSSVIKSSDSETARRRRDSLDQSWASFEPTRTTVKRVLLQEAQKTNMNKASLTDGQQLDPLLVDSSVVGHTKDLTTPLNLRSQSGNEGIQYALPKQVFEAKSTSSKWAGESPLLSQCTSQAAGLRSPILANHNAAEPSVSPYQVLPMTRRSLHKETSNLTADKRSGNIVTMMSNSAVTHERELTRQSGISLQKKLSVSMESPVLVPTSKSSEMLNNNADRLGLINPALETTIHGSRNTEGPCLESHIESEGTSFSFSTCATPGVSSYPGKVPQFGASASRSQTSEKASAFSMPISFLSGISPPSNVAFSVSNPSSIAPSLSAISSKINVDDNQTVSSTPFSSVPSPVLSSNSFSHQVPSSQFSFHAPPGVSGSCKTELQSTTGKVLPFPSPTLLSTPMSFETEVQPAIGNTSLSTSQVPSPPTSVFSLQGLHLPTDKTPPSPDPPSPLTSDPSKIELQPSAVKFSSSADVDAATKAPKAQPESPAYSLKLEPPASSLQATEISSGLKSGSQSNLNSFTSPASDIQLNAQIKQPSDVQVHCGAPLASDSAISRKNTSSDVAVAEQDEMEEEAPEASRVNEISLGSLGGFGLQSAPSSTAPRANPFGGSFGTIGANQASSSFTMTVPSGELFRPASFSFQSPQPSQPTNMGAFSGGFGSKAVAQAPAPSAFGQPALVGAGQQALGSVLGSFGQSRQFGAGLNGGFASASSVGGFTGTNAMGGFASAATGAGFAAVASTGGGGFGGFAGKASAGGGFGGAGFAAASPGSAGFAGAAGGGFASAGGGFGAFSSQQGAGGFSAFSGGNAGGTGNPPELFTQMRK